MLRYSIGYISIQSGLWVVAVGVFVAPPNTRPDTIELVILKGKLITYVHRYCLETSEGKISTKKESREYTVLSY